MRQRSRSSLPFVALALAAACAGPELELPGDEYLDVASTEEALGVSCIGTQECSGDGSVYTASLRVGSTPTSDGELLQTFTATADAAPAKVFVLARSLRVFTSAGVPMLRVAVYGPLTTPVSELDFDTLTPLLEGSTPVAALVGSSPTGLRLSGAGALLQGSTYALRLRADGVGAPGTGSVLVGIGALATTGYAGGESFRASRRSADAWGTRSPARFRPSGASDVAFAFSGANGSPCGDGADCASGTCTNATCASACVSGSQVFDYTYPGADKPFVVPTGCTSLTVKLWGAGGGSYATEAGGRAYGGGGGYASGVLQVTPGRTLTVVTGAGACGVGANLSNQIQGQGNCDPYGGGGNSRGGGRSAILDGTTSLIVAGGGGGGSADSASGGGGGGLTGADGAPGTSGLPGRGGSQTAGGVSPYGFQYSGRAGVGGSGVGGYGGGGGGGWYGGGGGGNSGSGSGGGGGGSSYIEGVQGGVTLPASGNTPGNASDPARNSGNHPYVSAIGAGGDPYTQFVSGVGPVSRFQGGHGRVIIAW